ncbi:MAG: hypothetical protein JRK26_18055 [Deltaproteobacteria bacterium]|nr:hypothetical protein [Deltaproteobacteria bacterium]
MVRQRNKEKLSARVWGIENVVDAVLLAGWITFLMVYFDIRYLFYDTVVTGGDTASWHAVADHLLRVLLPSGRLMGWDMGNFCGYPNFNFYFLPPFLLAVLPAKIFSIPLTIALKFSIMSGIFLFPVFMYTGLRVMGYRFPVPVIGSAGAVLFMFNESYTMFGGNALSTFAGEFCYMFSFALFPLFIGSFYTGAKDGKWVIRNGILLGLIGLSHLFVFLVALILPVYAFLKGTSLRYLLKMALVAFICMAFWLLPLAAFRHPYTTPVYMIWQEFVNLRYASAGVLILVAGMLPRMALETAAQSDSVNNSWKFGLIGLSALGSAAGSYLLGAYLVYGQDIWNTGLHFPDTTGAVIGKRIADWIEPVLIPFATAVGTAVFVAGWVCSLRFKISFARIAGGVCAAGTASVAAMALHLSVVRAMEPGLLRSLLINSWLPAALYGTGAVAAVYYFGVSARFSGALMRAASVAQPSRAGLWLSLAFGCVTAYFAAHFLEVPDIRFLPPLGLALLLLAVDTASAFMENRSLAARIFWATAACYLVLTAVIFGTKKSGNWFRYNNRGYEMAPGHEEFAAVNQYLRAAYEGKGLDPLNAPRVGYEKCDLYGPYGGDRVFESLPFFSGRQTLEGIHYASSLASRCMAFIQTEFSRDIKTPKPQILSKINPDALPAHFDLYNISQLVVMTDRMKKALAGSPNFEMEARFGNISLYRYTGAGSRYVDIPAVRPVLYAGKDWAGDFFTWFKHPDQNDVLLVPDKYVKNKEDRTAFQHKTESVLDLARFRKNRLNRQGLEIDTRLEHLRIRFTTNRIGVPHLVKVSYFPNWKVTAGANGVYPISPHLMVVIPRENTVTLTYGRSAWEIAGLMISAGGLIILLAATVGRRFLNTGQVRAAGRVKILWKQIWEAVEKLAFKIRPLAFVLVLIIAAGLIVSGAILRNRPVRIYIAGYKAYKQGTVFRKQGKNEQAETAFKNAIQIMKPFLDERFRYDHRDVINSLLITAGCYENLKDYKKAEAWYRILFEEYPYSRYVAEGYVKLARIYSRRMRKLWRAGVNQLKQGFDLKGHGMRMEALDLMEKSLGYYQQALIKDPYSVWADYARKDLEREKNTLEKVKSELFSSPNDPGIRRRVELLMMRLEKIL